MKKASPILLKSADYVFNLLREKLPANHIYHNYAHTTEVVEAVAEIAEGIGLSKEETEMVLLAAWFHDTGFIEVYAGHEERSKAIAERFLVENLYPAEKIERIKGCIDATKYPQRPTNLLEYIICDADLSGIASKKYWENANFLRQEQELVLNKKYTESEWIKTEIEFLTQHKYHTPYCYLAYEKRKTQHVLELRQKLEDLEKSEGKEREKRSRKEEERLIKESRPDRGIETVFRLTINNHMSLSKMADDKANFLLSINGIILSFALANLVSKLDVQTNYFLVGPTAILMLVCLVSIIFAVLSTRPKLIAGSTTREDIEKKRANLLFFGNFHKMQLDEFNWGFSEMMKDREFLYGSMIRDLYYLGQVLGRKYFLIRIAYTVFMWGIIIAVLSYAVSYWYYFMYSPLPQYSYPQ
ncbi:MAG: phosphohydrolase [Chitinophagales bacterium]|nr:phosphohydrolase [Chitinophagales bacterium]